MTRYAARRRLQAQNGMKLHLMEELRRLLRMVKNKICDPLTQAFGSFLHPPCVAAGEMLGHLYFQTTTEFADYPSCVHTHPQGRRMVADGCGKRRPSKGKNVTSASVLAPVA